MIVLERLQAKALKAIYGFEPSYRERIEKSGLTTLRARREARELAFARKCAESSRFRHWFPRRPARNTRSPELFLEEFDRCCRFYDSPIYSMRRRLNKEIRPGGIGKEGQLRGLRTARASGAPWLTLG